ncbi:DUF397 domain-containing protein [Streptantibioticus rubrisoli]|uniref:DUF397 domain-containing protein n=1 Tax=Streptantibioticus rubrisoli TaxID=1387313 RepID=A0ABT1PDG5_9ACTN|nr:DUF397 domain-containing protein [Streptantibioticus rubrisoli]MCQ4042498.1 DUF397 domain-containing protein [Streptantibioticus rubrisoli]
MSTGAIDQLTWFKSSYSSGEGGACIEVALDWRTSSYSGSGGGQCIEVAMDWRKSSHSSEHGGQCVEVATCPTTVHVRDSKDKSGPVLSFTPQAWSRFVEFAARL